MKGLLRALDTQGRDHDGSDLGRALLHLQVDGRLAPPGDPLLGFVTHVGEVILALDPGTLIL